MKTYYTIGDWDNEPDSTDSIATSAFRIESRWPQWAKWRIVGPAPHSEQYPFDSKGLAFKTISEAHKACVNMALCNAGEFRVVLPNGDPLPTIDQHGELAAALRRCAAVLRRQVNGIKVSDMEINAGLEEANNILGQEGNAIKHQA